MTEDDTFDHLRYRVEVGPGGLRRYFNSSNQLHRDDGPAVYSPGGVKMWYKNGKIHKEDGPAVEYPNGRKDWYFEGRHHRTDGPAIEDPSGHTEYWIKGVSISERQFLFGKANGLIPD